jgi:hypothetical protein
MKGIFTFCVIGSAAEKFTAKSENRWLSRRGENGVTPVIAKNKKV